MIFFVFLAAWNIVTPGCLLQSDIENILWYTNIHNTMTLGGQGLSDDASALYFPSDRKLRSTHNAFHSMQLASFLVRDKWERLLNLKMQCFPVKKPL